MTKHNSFIESDGYTNYNVCSFRILQLITFHTSLVTKVNAFKRFRLQFTII
jgi:hypothetical protein